MTNKEPIEDKQVSEKEWQIIRAVRELDFGSVTVKVKHGQPMLINIQRTITISNK